MDLTTQPFAPFQSASNIKVEFFAVIPVVCERRVDLPERQTRVLEVHFLGTPPIRLLLDNQLHDLHRRTCDARNAILIQHDMFVARFHKHLSTPRVR